ncbi:MAG TPA: RnfABCDGE type electron transport complex subunit G, partial [Tenuifilaceae bacterium]|nr:RnfABCDGE type electron transport complex subunit G [Tenuifilaceae bacterium]
GFGGRIELMVGFLPDGTINKITVISHKETPGLGDKIDPGKSDFSVQFEGKNPETFKVMVKKDGGDVDAITASTISSRAFCDAVNRAYKAFKEGGRK